MIDVLIADDQSLVRAGFRALIDAEPDLRVVGEAADGHQAVELARSRRPDVILMDVRMPGTDGIEATRRIASSMGMDSTRILILTTFDLDEYVFDGLAAGAAGFLLKDTEPAELLRAIRVIAAGDALIAPSVTRRLIARFVATRPVPAGLAELERLTDREREVLGLVAQGLSNDEIAEALVISPLTVKTHVSRVMMKLHARDRAQLVVIAYQTGLVRPG